MAVSRVIFKKRKFNLLCEKSWPFPLISTTTEPGSCKGDKQVNLLGSWQKATTFLPPKRHVGWEHSCIPKKLKKIVLPPRDDASDGSMEIREIVSSKRKGKELLDTFTNFQSKEKNTREVFEAGATQCKIQGDENLDNREESPKRQSGIPSIDPTKWMWTTAPPDADTAEGCRYKICGDLRYRKCSGLFDPNAVFLLKMCTATCSRFCFGATQIIEDDDIALAGASSAPNKQV
jgi:hypothetical protein